MSADTSREAQARFDALMRARSGSERVIMACEMFDLARALMTSRIRELEPEISDNELKVRILERLYGDDLDAETLERVSARIRSTLTAERGR